MDTIEVVRRYIDGEEGRVAFLCQSKEDVSRLFKIVKAITHPSYYYVLDLKRNVFGTYGYEKEICYRFERSDGKLDWGHDHKEFYIRRGRKIINVRDLLDPNDYGEFQTCASDLNSLLFGNIKA